MKLPPLPKGRYSMDRRSVASFAIPMEAAYIDFARALGAERPVISSDAFAMRCIKEVSVDTYGVNMSALTSIFMGCRHPEMRVIEGGVLIAAGLIPFGNLSEAFASLTQELMLDESQIALAREEDGRIFFALSLSGIKRMAEPYEGVCNTLKHAELVSTAVEAYNAAIN